MDLITDYKRTLKMPEAEEIFDLLFYRPVAYAFVRSIGKTRITPNQVTGLSLLFGIAAAYLYSLSKLDLLLPAAVLYTVANILDCADGQLARLQKSGTFFGRVLDGAADYVSSAAIFLGLGLGLSTAYAGIWILVILAALSTAVHAMFFDYYQSEFISAVRSDRIFHEMELAKFTGEIESLRNRGRSRLRLLILTLYVRYLYLQKAASTKQHQEKIAPEQYKSENLQLIRLWSFLGPTTNRTILIVCSLFGRPDVYLWSVVIAGNLWLAFCYFLRRKVHQRLVVSVSDLE